MFAKDFLIKFNLWACPRTVRVHPANIVAAVHYNLQDKLLQNCHYLKNHIFVFSFSRVVCVFVSKRWCHATCAGTLKCKRVRREAARPRVLLALGPCRSKKRFLTDSLPDSQSGLPQKKTTRLRLERSPKSRKRVQVLSRNGRLLPQTVPYVVVSLTSHGHTKTSQKTKMRLFQ